MRTRGIHSYQLQTVCLGICILAMTACAHKPPTIAHTHIGHAVTAFDGTPEEKGLFTVAEERALEALAHAAAASRENNDLDEIKEHVQAVVEAYRSEDFCILTLICAN